MAITKEEAIQAVATVRQENAVVVAEVIRKAGIAEPFSTAQAIHMATAAEYACNRPKVDYLLGQKMIPTPAKQLGRLAWSVEDVLNLCDLLEQKRSFLPFAERHAPKLDWQERRKQNQALAEIEQLEAELTAKTSRELLNTMAMADSLHVRLMCRQILDERAKVAAEATKNVSN